MSSSDFLTFVFFKFLVFFAEENMKKPTFKIEEIFPYCQKKTQQLGHQPSLYVSSSQRLVDL